MSDTPRTDAEMAWNAKFSRPPCEETCRSYVRLVSHAKRLERAVAAADRVYVLLSKIKLTSEDVFTLNGLGQALADLENALEEAK